jgi:predicted Zn finger-like uncharacterized protein
MLIACPNCGTSYKLDVAALGTRGRPVRCACCRTVWFAVPPAAEPEAVMARAAEEATFRAEFGAEAAAAPPSEPANGIAAPQEPPATPEPAPPAPEPEPSPAPAANAIAPAEIAVDPVPEPAPLPAEVVPMALSDIPIPVDDAPPITPHPGAAHAVIDNGAADIETVALRRARARTARARAKRNMQLPALIGALAFACVALIGLRKDMVRHVPQLASFYASIGMPVNLRGLSFADLKLGRENHDGVPVLAVEGIIVNDVPRPVEVPRLRFALHNAAGVEVYAWTAVPSQSMLEPGERLPFRSRLASPPDDSAEVQVRFFTHRDAVADPN